MYKYNKQDNLYLWGNDCIYFYLTEPRIYPFNDGTMIEEYHDILHFYYSFGVKNQQSGETIFSGEAYDFPKILEFSLILNEIYDEGIDLEEVGSFQRVSGENGIDVYSKKLTIGGVCCDDSYSLERVIISQKNKKVEQRYNLYLGKNLSFSNASSVGINITDLRPQEVRELKNMVNDFIDDAIKNTNKITRKLMKIMRESLSKRNDKLYQTAQNYSTVNPEIYPDYIDAIYVVGDKISVDYLGEDRKITHAVSGVLEVIGDDYLVCSGMTVFYDRIVYISNDVSPEKLKFNAEEIKNDFLKIIGDYESKQLQKMSEEQAFEFFEEALINRTWMCRKEHNLPVLVKDRNTPNFNIENAHENAKRIFAEIYSSYR